MRTLLQYARLAFKKGKKCPSCGNELEEENIRHYDHDGGWKVRGFKQKRWLYFECPKCRYGASFTKFDVPR